MPAIADAGLETVAVSPGGPLALGAVPVRVTLVRPGGAAAAFDPTLAPRRQAYVVIADFRAQAQPGVRYGIYLDLPDGAPAERRERHFVGSLNFFAAVEGPRTARYNATEVMHRLHAQGLLGDPPSVTLVPTGIPDPSARPEIGQISLVVQ